VLPLLQQAGCFIKALAVLEMVVAIQLARKSLVKVMACYVMVMVTGQAEEQVAEWAKSQKGWPASSALLPSD
jgi:hypothetical protein